MEIAGSNSILRPDNVCFTGTKFGVGNVVGEVDLGADGISDKAKVGVLEGDNDTNSLGNNEGKSVGRLVGEVVGILDVVKDGDELATVVGSSLKRIEGSSLATLDGALLKVNEGLEVFN